MCRRVLLAELWLLVGTRSCLLVVGLLSIAEPLCPSRCLFRTILVTPCLMVWDWRVSRAEPMISCRHDLLFLWCLLLFYLLLTSMGWLCGVGVFWTDRVFSLSPGLAKRTPNDNNNMSLLSRHRDAMSFLPRLRNATSLLPHHRDATSLLPRPRTTNSDATSLLPRQRTTHRDATSLLPRQRTTHRE